MNSTTTRNLIRPIIRGAYDQQKLRIQTGNRIVANFKAKIGQTPGQTEDETLTPEAAELLSRLRMSYNLIASAVAEFKPRKGEAKIFKGDELIENATELALVEQYLDLEHQEKRTFKRVESVLQNIPIYTQYLTHIKGIGPAMAGVIVSEIDIHEASNISKLWKYAGLDVVINPETGEGAGRSRRPEHLIDREYTDKDGNPAVRKSITFNPWLKTKLLGVLAGNFLRNNNERYRKIYDDYKFRLENHERHKDKPKHVRHRMALRYMIKQFLADLYLAWRRLEGLAVTAPYHEAKLGIVHSGADDGMRGMPDNLRIPRDSSVSYGSRMP